jgi:hypothetical protein
MEIEYRGKKYTNFIIYYQDGIAFKIEIFKQGDHFSSQPRHTIHTSIEKVKITYFHENS